MPDRSLVPSYDPPAAPAALAIGARYNKSDLAIWLKIAACFLTVFVFWDLKFGEACVCRSRRGTRLRGRCARLKCNATRGRVAPASPPTTSQALAGVQPA